MPSLRHEILVELFRADGELAVELLRSHAGLAVDHARVEPGSSDLSQVVPAEYRADAVLILRDRSDRPVTGVVVEVQRQVDRDKRRSWPVYVTALRAKLDCAVVLVVIAPDPDVAAWARQPIDLGHPGFCLEPVVISFEDVPRVRDRARALRVPELAVLSVMAHPELDLAELAIEAIGQLPADRSQLYLDVILMALPDLVRQTLEARMQRYEYQSEFARKYYGQGVAEGIEKGRQDGLRAAVVTLARTKLGGLSESEASTIEALSDLRVLTELVTSLGEARTAADARAALVRALGR